MPDSRCARMACNLELDVYLELAETRWAVRVPTMCSVPRGAPVIQQQTRRPGSVLRMWQELSSLALCPPASTGDCETSLSLCKPKTWAVEVQSADCRIVSRSRGMCQGSGFPVSLLGTSRPSGSWGPSVCMHRQIEGHGLQIQLTPRLHERG